MELYEQHSRDKEQGKSFLLVSIIIVCAVSVGLIGFVYLYKKAYAQDKVTFVNNDGSSTTFSLSTIEKADLFDYKTEERESLSLDQSPFTLIVFISPGDCPNCLDERTVWAELKQSNPKLRVIGVLIKSSTDEIKAFEKAFNFPFETYFDKDRVLEQNTNLPATPFKILIDKSKHIILADGPNPSLSAQKKFGEKVKKTLNALGS